VIALIILCTPDDVVSASSSLVEQSVVTRAYISLVTGVRRPRSTNAPCGTAIRVVRRTFRFRSRSAQTARATPIKHRARPRI